MNCSKHTTVKFMYTSLMVWKREHILLMQFKHKTNSEHYYEKCFYSILLLHFVD